jgi:hypothetical protein
MGGLSVELMEHLHGKSENRAGENFGDDGGFTCVRGFIQSDRSSIKAKL